MMRSKYYAGIDVGGTNIKIILCDASFKMLAQRSIPTNVPALPAATVNRIAESIEDMASDANQSPEGLVGVGVALPGLVDYKDNSPINMGTLKWNGFDMDIAGLMKERFNVPALLMNDGSAHLMGEFMFGAAQGHQNAILLSLGTGIGGAAMANGRIIEGENGLAGEMGHMILESGGEECSCGGRGCFQAYCSATGIMKFARRLMNEYADTILWELSDGNPEKLETSMITQGALRHDEVCLKVFNRASRYLGMGIATLISIFNPEMILIGGGVANANEFLVEPAKEVAWKHLLNKKQRCFIKTVTLGPMSGAWGACAWISDRMEKRSAT